MTHTDNKSLYIQLQAMIGEYMATPQFYSQPHQFQPFIERWCDAIAALQNQQPSEANQTNKE